MTLLATLVLREPHPTISRERLAEAAIKVLSQPSAMTTDAFSALMTAAMGVPVFTGHPVSGERFAWLGIGPKVLVRLRLNGVGRWVWADPQEASI